LVNELWTIKYGGQYNKSPEIAREIIGLVANCKITEEVWSAILNQFESQLELLLLQIVKSSACNAPKLTRMLLKRNGSLLELQVMVSTRSTPYDAFDGLYPANEKMRILVNELNKAKETMRILLEADVNATVDSVKLGYLAIQYAATKESSSAPKIIEVLLEHGASPSSNGYTAFLVAARNEGHYALEMMKQ
ncbi:Uncharacterized protein APZ42_005705, partial [Daphnia magna]